MPHHLDDRIYLTDWFDVVQVLLGGYDARGTLTGYSDDRARTAFDNGIKRMDDSCGLGGRVGRLRAGQFVA